MQFTKTQTEIMKVFVTTLAGKFTVSQISELAGKPYPLVHRSVKPLLENKLISKDERGLLFLNYKEHFSDISYIESLRSGQFLEKNKTIALFVKDVLNEIKQNFFILLVFGSSVSEKKPHDVDILLIVPEKKNVAEYEAILDRIASNFSVKFDCNAISAESVREMLSKRDEPNVMNETLNNHIIVFGAENYYRLLKYAR